MIHRNRFVIQEVQVYASVSILRFQADIIYFYVSETIYPNVNPIASLACLPKFD